MGDWSLLGAESEFKPSCVTKDTQGRVHVLENRRNGGDPEGSALSIHANGLLVGTGVEKAENRMAV